MHEVLEFLKQLISVGDPNYSNWLAQHGGLILVCFIIFAETGLFVGFFLPGDSLLFITGVILASTTIPFAAPAANLAFWISMISLAGILGNAVGYWFGRKSGPLLFERRETWLFKKKHLLQAKDFYEKRGGSAIILARFLPIVRTFAPIVAGVVQMNARKFFLYNVIGSLAWVVSMIVTGYLLGNNEWVKGNLEKIVIGLILVTTLPVLFKMFLGKKKDPVQEVAEDVVQVKTPSASSTHVD
jgi:membrane-associated protein